MRGRTPSQIRRYDIFKTIMTIVLLLLLISLLAFRFLRGTPAPAPTLKPTVVITTEAPLPTQGIVATTIPTSTSTATVTPTSPPEPTFTLVPSLTPSATSIATSITAPTNTQQPTPTFTLAPTLTPTVVPVGTACPPYGARGTDLGATYITVYCDTLSNIAESTGVSLEALIKANPQIPDPNLIFSGNVVVIPAPRK
jgi:LysM repeat protein